MTTSFRAVARLGAAATLAAAMTLTAGCESVGLNDLGPSLVDDAALSESVRAALAAAPETLNQRILVKTLDAGMVRLSGLVDSDSIAVRAEQIADAVPGVTSVINTLQVQ